MSTFEEWLAGTAPPTLPRTVIDPVTGRPYSPPSPTGEVVQRASVLPVGRDDSGRLVPAVPGMLMSAAEAAALPGQVARGEFSIFDPRTGHVSDEAIAKVTDLAGLAMTGSMPFEAPAGALRVFGGRTARTADHAALDRAAEMQAAGTGPDAIWRDTGWGLGRDGVARFEVPDEAARLRPHDGSPNTTLGQVLDHPALFEAYPQMRDVQVFHRPELGADAAANPSKNWIALNLDDAQALPALLHESQHIVQRQEGFAPGASPIDPALAAHPQVAEVAALRQRLTGLANPQAEALASRADQAARMEAYRTAAGEVEARNVETRQAMSPAERSASPPWSTQDIPTARQWLPQSHGVTGDGAQLRTRSAPSSDIRSGGPGGAIPAAVAATAADSPQRGRKMPNPFDDLDAAYPPPPPAAGTGGKAGPFDDLDAIPDPRNAPPAGGQRAKGAGNAFARGVVDGVPIVGPYLLSGIDKADAAVRALSNDTTYSDEAAKAEGYGRQMKTEHPWATTGGEIVGGIAGTAPLVVAAPAAFGAGAGGLGARTLASAFGGTVLGAADSAVRSEGDGWATATGAGIGGALGAAGPVAGKVIGAGVRSLTGSGRTNALVGEALEGISDKDLAAAQQLIEQARSLPGAPVHLTLDEALNAVTGGQATRASQLARVVANSGGEGGRVMNEVYAGRPGTIDSAGRAAMEGVAPPIADPTGLGFDIQDAARRGVAQTPEGMALTAARDAAGPRVSADQAGQIIQPEMVGMKDRLVAKRTAEANRDYAAAREAPETVGVERQVAVERPGEPVVTEARYSRPQFTDAAPRPLDPPPTVEAQAGAAPESLARFIARNGGIRLDGEARATDLQRFNIPGVGNVARPNGKGIDDFWRERLIEEGYFRPDADGGMARDITNDLLRRLQNEQRGVPSYPIGQERAAAAERMKPGQVQDEYRAALSQAESRLDTDLRGAGIDPETLHPDTRSRVLGAMMRGEETDPVSAYERTVAGMKDPPAPFSKSTTVSETIPDVRHGQANPQPVVDYIDRLLETAKGPAARALASARKTLFAPNGRDLDLSVEGLHNARGAINDLIGKAQPSEQRALMGARNKLDEALGAVPEYERARSTFAANSVPLAPFEGEAPLAQVTRRDQTTKRLATPTEEVPSHLMGATATREFLANATPEARKAHADHLVTRIMDAATDKRGTIDPDKLHAAIRDKADVLAQMPEVFHRLDGVVVAQDGMARVMASPLGRIAKQDPVVGKAVDALFPANPGPGTHAEIAETVGALAKNRPLAARQLVRYYLEATFNEATQDLRGLPRQYGGAGFASAVRGNAQQRQNLEAALRALPDGETTLAGMDRLFDVLEATGYRPRTGSDTAFNTEIQRRIKDGTGTLGKAITEVASSAAAGAGVGGPKGALGGAALGAKRAGSEILQKVRMARDGAAVARILTDPKATAMLDRLSKQPEGSRGAELLATKLLQMGAFGAAKGAQSSPAPGR